jgi:glycosyltransferase involved in cell wall biosynthesis
VESSAVHRPDETHVVGEEQRIERDTTFYVPTSPVRLARAHVGLLLRSPRRYVAAMRLAAETSRPGVAGHLKQVSYFAGAGGLAAHLRKKKFDHLHSHFGDVSTSVAMLAAELSGVPFSFTLHGPGVFFEAHTWRLDAKIERAAFVSCISWFCRSQAQLFGGESNADKLHIVHCGIDPNRYRDRSREVDDERESFDLVCVGRLDHVKGIGVLLDALATVVKRVPLTRLHLVGDGPKRSDYEQRVTELGLTEHVVFAGYRSQSEVAEILGRSDAYVLASFAEGVPVVLMEAQASGLPVVATAVGGVGELVIDGVTGHLCAPGDAAGLAERLVQLSADVERRRRFGAAGRARVIADFNSSDEGARLADLFNHASSNRSLGPRPPLPALGG